MKNDHVAGQWKQRRGSAKEWWGKLTDSDLDRIAGKRDQLVGALQEKYGYTREKASEEVDRRLKEYDQKQTTPTPPVGKMPTPGTTPPTPVGKTPMPGTTPTPPVGKTPTPVEKTPAMSSHPEKKL